MREASTKQEAQELVAERKAALAEAKAANARPGNHVRGGMHVRQAEEGLEKAEALLAEFK